MVGHHRRDEPPAHELVTGRGGPIAVSSSYPAVATGGYDRVGRIWDTTSDRPPLELLGNTAPVLAVALNPTGTVAATGGQDGVIRLWNTGTGRRLAALTRHQGQLNDLQFDDSGRRPLSESEDRTIRIWAIPQVTRNVLDTLRHPIDPNDDRTLSPDGSLLATGGDSVQLWTADGEFAGSVYTSRRDGATPELFSPDGERLAVYEDGVVRIVDVDAGNADQRP